MKRKLRKLAYIVGITIGIAIPAYETVVKQTSTVSGIIKSFEPDFRCKHNESYCIDSGTFIARITQILESDSKKSRQVRVTVEFQNQTNHILPLVYREDSSVLVDNFRLNYYPSRKPHSFDASAVGMGTDAGGKIDAQFILAPKASDSVIFHLWRSRPPADLMSFFQFQIMIEELKSDDLKMIRTRHPLLFKNVTEATISQQIAPLKEK